MTAPRLSHCPGCGKALGRSHRCTGRRAAPTGRERAAQDAAAADAAHAHADLVARDQVGVELARAAAAERDPALTGPARDAAVARVREAIRASRPPVQATLGDGTDWKLQ